MVSHIVGIMFNDVCRQQIPTRRTYRALQARLDCERTVQQHSSSSLPANISCFNLIYVHFVKTTIYETTIAGALLSHNVANMLLTTKHIGLSVINSYYKIALFERENRCFSSKQKINKEF